MEKKFIIAIDGPAGSGKSTLASKIAQILGIMYLDTGAMYRAITYLALKNNIVDDTISIINIVKNVDLQLKYENNINRVFVDGIDITNEIRTLEVNSKVSEVSKIKEVREELVKLQQKIGNSNSLIAEGRDTTTVVFPNADIKIFLVATIGERAERRYKEFVDKGLNGSLNEIKENLSKRDKIDSGREISPLIKADDAIELDTTDLTIDQEVDVILEKIREKKIFKSSQSTSV